MAKSENPIDVYRRQQRKKDLKKNKSSRIKARDAKVAATRSLEDVKTEISLLERKRDRNDEKTGLDAIETKKLERLRKELRIVSAETVKRKALAEQAQIERDKELLAAQKTVEGVQKLNESKYSLLERYASVYYDEQMNPFGAPEPGKPKMYYADVEGKSTSMDLRRAIVPEKWRKKFDAERGVNDSQEDISRVVRKRRWDDPGDNNNHQMMPPPVNLAAPQHIHPPPAFPPPPPHHMQMPPPPHMPQQMNNFPPPPPPRQMAPPPPPMPPPPVPPPPPPLPPRDKSQPPALPAPSKSVLRAAKRSSGKRNAMADIWASQEEMEFEQSLGGNSMEGAADAMQQQNQPYMPRWKRNKQNANSKDKNADVNDPCCPSAGGYGEYRNKNQIERQSKEVAKLKKQQHDHVAKHLASTVAAQKEQESAAASSYNVQQPIWYYRDNTSGAMQGPFSGEQMMGWRSFFPMTTPVRFGHRDGEFVALSDVDFVSPPLPSPPVPPPPPPPLPEATVADPAGNDTNVASSVENELETKPEAGMTMPPLTAEDELEPAISVAEVAEPQITDNGPGVEMCLPPPSDDEGYDDDREEGDDDGTTVKHDDPEADMCVPPPPDDEGDGENYLDGKDGGHEAGMCLPPPSDNEEESGIPYPAVGEYPLPSDDDVPYPVDVEYPVDDAYGYPDTGDAYGDAEGEMAAVAPYPSTDDVFGVTDHLGDQQIGEPGVMPPPVEEKKEFKGDKAVIGFMPTNLRVKRKVAKPTKKPVAKQVAPTTVSEPHSDGKRDEQGKYSVADDYNKFMEEISELK